VNRTEQEKTEIKGTDLVLLMSVVEAAAGLYNALEIHEPTLVRNLKAWRPEYDDLGCALRDLGLPEVEAT
jgi:hypothetical protein